jgi:hypothetical protein
MQMRLSYLLKNSMKIVLRCTLLLSAAFHIGLYSLSPSCAINGNEVSLEMLTEFADEACMGWPKMLMRLCYDVQQHP